MTTRLARVASRIANELAPLRVIVLAIRWGPAVTMFYRPKDYRHGLEMASSGGYEYE